ncbi:MAG TPA: hypothetical protein VJ673_24010 [Aromatoleum sp.]|uniref:hypothetical protein n=1 Tax=Aromatoleum sp. TaxID=2307007 RepID=UPI002B467DA5|nr:hypothetical protein [Aromatoleum sp.]HJV28763.1 hypothetical protein [Aromatoleum sp.]
MIEAATRIPEQRGEPFGGRVPPARASTPEGKRAPDRGDDRDELADVAVLSTN